MWSDEINKKIEEAEGTNNPAYNDKAWENMELLLDKHLPQNKKRRRFILFLLPLALAGGAVFFILQKRTTDTSLTDQKNILVQPSSSIDKPRENTGSIATAPSKNTSVQSNPVNTTTENNLSETETLNEPLPDQERAVYNNKINPGTNKKADKQTQSFLKNRTNKPVKQTETTNDNNNLNCAKVIYQG